MVRARRVFKWRWIDVGDDSGATLPDEGWGMAGLAELVE
jgi:hypothetical protein